MSVWGQLGLYSLPGLPFTASRTCTTLAANGKTIKHWDKSSKSALMGNGDVTEMMGLGLGSVVYAVSVAKEEKRGGRWGLMEDSISPEVVLHLVHPNEWGPH